MDEPKLVKLIADLDGSENLEESEQWLRCARCSTVVWIAGERYGGLKKYACFSCKTSYQFTTRREIPISNHEAVMYMNKAKHVR